jgi:drug/metabolite transporter (DMT)-like permease
LTVLARWALDGVRPSPALLGCVAAAFAGVALVVVGDHPSAALKGGAGDLLVLLAVVCWVRYTLSAADDFGGWSPLRFTALTAAAGTLTVLAITAAGDATGVLAPPSGADASAVAPSFAYIVLAGAVVAVLAWNAGVVRLGPSNAALFMNLVPVVTFTIEAFRGATPGPVEVLGAGVTLAALVAANLTLRQRRVGGARSARATARLAAAASAFGRR